MKKFYSLFIYLAVFSFLFTGLQAGITVQSDTVKAPDVATAPTIDGVGTDAAWQTAAWQTIDNVWLNPGGAITNSDDYTGRYKIAWSSANNLVYMLVEITDEYFDYGYVPLAGGYPDFDCIEIFIDEDRSGGYHLIDGPGTDVWGFPRSNGENAFAYHMLPGDDLNSVASSSTVYAIDLTGGPTDSPTAIDYNSHIPDFIVAKSGNVYTWEFSMAIYDDTYDNASPAASRVTLTANKVMGLTVAYNDDDTPIDGRDNMIGSVDPPAGQENDSYADADIFGVLKLVSDVSNTAPTVANPIPDVNLVDTSPYAAATDLKTVFNDSDGDNLSFSAVSDNVHLTVTIGGTDALIVTSDGNLGGIATVTVTADDGLASVDDVFTVSDPVSINTLESFKNSIKIYPQPAQGFVNISIQNTTYSDINISVIDITGKNVLNASYQKENNAFEQRVNLSDLSQGIYFINIQQEDNKDVRKIIKY